MAPPWRFAGNSTFPRCAEISEVIERLATATGGQDDLRFFPAPGRVNLMGDHTDDNEEFLMTHQGLPNRAAARDGR